QSELQVAWDFVTVSRQNSLDRLISMQEDALQFVQENEPDHEITLVEDGDCSIESTKIARTIWGRIRGAPSYKENGRFSLLTRDQESLVDGIRGKPVRSGTLTIPFIVRIPCSIASSPDQPSFMLQYGHGLLGDRSEIRAQYLADMADAFRWIIFGTDWYGMSRFDIPYVARILLTEVCLNVSYSSYFLVR
ncbi:MAG: hypothetical protein ACK4UN_17140, partial [Limisphaerales bacterium]